MNYTIVQDSRIGGREINQDRVAWLATEDAVLMVVADGMGGHLQGEVAAQLAVDTISERFRAAAKARLVDPAQFLAAALQQAHESIVRYAADCRIPSHSAPRTTCIACVVQDGQVNWAHAGDSRLYLIHGRAKGDAGFMRTRDHSLVQRMVDDGIIESGQAASHPLRNRVFSCLGGDLTPSIEVSRTVPLQNGDVIALCTDGAWAPLGEKLVRELGRASLTTSVPHLLDAAEQAAGPEADNLTLIAMRWEAPDPDAHTLNLRPDALPATVAAPLSDEEIDDAVAEIRRRMPYTPTGASS
ncbi:MAG: protein phosphatase 2C domain-containing protein [Sulfuritalea sp.]|nr:protein phosphatase 2C domain-containing protein [Sulfuritalea sp.]